MTNWSYGAASVTTRGTLTTTTYTPVTHKATKRGACPECGKTNTRSRTFEATVNPLNKDPETGEPRTYGQVLETLRAKEPGWTPDFTCTKHAEEAEDAVPTARPTDPDVTARVLAGMRAAADFAEAHGLPMLPGVEVHGCTPRYNPETRASDLPPTPVIEMIVRGSRELHTWAVVLEAATVGVHRQSGITCLTVKAEAGTVSWVVRAFYDRALGARDAVTWKVYSGKRSEYGDMTVEALAALPERDRAQAGE